MKKLILVIVTMSASMSFALPDKNELKLGQSVVICKSDFINSKFERTSGLSELNKTLIQDSITTTVNTGGFSTATITINSPFDVSAPSIAEAKYNNETRFPENSYTYCVTVTKK